MPDARLRTTPTGSLFAALWRWMFTASRKRGIYECGGSRQKACDLCITPDWCKAKKR